MAATLYKRKIKKETLETCGGIWCGCIKTPQEIFSMGCLQKRQSLTLII